MPLSPRADSSSAVTSFAGLLAGFTAPAPEADPDWNDSLLADDVATIRYKRAQDHPASPAAESQASLRTAPPSLAEGRKSASITIRLSDAECALLHKRADSAGLTMSAYLRSCVFEVESLRSQVKEALSQIRSASTREPKPVQPAMATAPSHARSGWLAGLLSRRHREQPRHSA
jgi:hypothetical protein